MTPSDDPFNVPPDVIAQEEAVTRRILVMFEEEELSIVPVLTTLVALLSYTYLTRLRNERGLLEYAVFVGECVADAIPIMEAIGTESFRYGDKPPN